MIFMFQNHQLIAIKSFAVLFVALAVFLAGCTSGGTDTAGDNAVAAGTNREIEITASGFSPSQLNISAGDTVTFANKDMEKHWPASAMHPTHRVYPGSGIEKCGTGEQDGIFDSCRGLEQGETFEFTFNERGRWCYHDHMKANLFGCINVE